jgi:hypothetical protein
MKIFSLLLALFLISCQPKAKIVYKMVDIQPIQECFISVQRPPFTKLTVDNLEFVIKYIKELQGYITDLELTRKSEQQCVFNITQVSNA